MEPESLGLDSPDTPLYTLDHTERYEWGAPGRRCRCPGALNPYPAPESRRPGRPRSTISSTDFESNAEATSSSSTPSLVRNPSMTFSYRRTGGDRLSSVGGRLLKYSSTVSGFVRRSPPSVETAATPTPA